MSDSEFPSGSWTGFYSYQQFPGKFRTDLILTFQHGRMTGEGNDTVGPFVISGHYNTASKECHWTKTYVSSHDVFYKGFREGKGIWGTWEIGELARGGFHIWPLEDDLHKSESDHEERELPVEAPAVAAPRNQ